MPFTVAHKQTLFDHIRFRSRNEARFAVMFNALEVPWQYEPTWFTFPVRPCSALAATHPSGNMKYLPDLYLPEADVYLEIKPKEPTTAECVKVYCLARHLHADVHVLWHHKKNLLLTVDKGGNFHTGHCVRQCVTCGKLRFREAPCEHRVFSTLTKKLKAARTKAVNYTFEQV